MKDTTGLLTVESIRNCVYTIRGQQVMLDSDLADIYGYEVKRLNEQVKRNINRFPEDFMFQIEPEELPKGLKSQIATLNEAPSPYRTKKKMEVIDRNTQKPVRREDGTILTEEVEVTVPAFRVTNVFDINVKSFIMLKGQVSSHQETRSLNGQTMKTNLHASAACGRKCYPHIFKERIIELPSF